MPDSEASIVVSRITKIGQADYAKRAAIIVAFLKRERGYDGWFAYGRPMPCYASSRHSTFLLYSISFTGLLHLGRILLI